MINRGQGSVWNCGSRGPLGRIGNCWPAQLKKKSAPSSSRCVAQLPLLLFLAACIAMAGCGITGRIPGGTLTPIISVKITQAPPVSLLVGGTAIISATVSNDVASAGVDWVAACGSAPNCGSFSPANSASGATAVFTAPLSVPANRTIAVTALSATDHSKAFAATVTIVSTVSGVTITQPPPATAPGGAAITLGASVAGDPSNEGVDWKATCLLVTGPVNCGPIGLHSSSGGTVQFFVPSPLQFPTIVGSMVTVTAFATADHSFSASATFSVTDAITISMTQAPPSTMLTNATASVVATAVNDTTNSGVTWSVSCSNTPCGTVAPAQTASGQTATFTAPPVVPPPDGKVVVTATSNAGGSQVVATAIVTIIVPVTVQITTGVPINSIVQSASAPLIAAVTGDTAAAGVDWTVTCGNAGACGTFLPLHTASGATTTYTAPSAVPAGSTVTITAASTTDPTKFAKQTVTVTSGVPPNSLLRGQFVILLTARKSVNGPFVVGGLINGDGKTDINGNGSITQAYLDVTDASGNATTGIGLSSPGSYSIGTDGRGQIHLTINNVNLNPNIGVNGSGAITLSVVFVSPHHALLIETDSFGEATGTLDWQDGNAVTALQAGGFNGNYSLQLSGTETASPYLGYFVASGVTILSSQVRAYVTDQSAGGAITSVPATVVTSGQPTLGSNGELTLSSVNLGLPTLFNLDVWLIDANHFVVTDWRDSASGNPAIIVGGYLTAQSTAPAISGTYAFHEAGATPTAQPQAAGGIFTCGSAGILDVTPLGGTLTTNQAITAACTAPASGRGLITLTGAASTGISKFAAYPTLDQGLYLIELDGGTTGSTGSGEALLQTVTSFTAAALSGNYAATYSVGNLQDYENIAAQIISAGGSALSGTADVNSFAATGAPSFNAVLTGSSFTAGANGRFPMSLTITPATGQPTPQFLTVPAACYIVDANTCLLVGLDTTAPGSGILQLQQPGL